MGPGDSSSLAANHVEHLDRVLKNRDITLLTKVHLVKAMVSLVVTYGCETWTIKKVELVLLNSGVGEDS